MCMFLCERRLTLTKEQLSVGPAFHFETGSLVYHSIICQASWPVSCWGFTYIPLHLIVGVLELQTSEFVWVLEI